MRSPLGSLAINSARREKSSRERGDDGTLLRGSPKRAREGGIEEGEDVEVAPQQLHFMED